METISVIIPAYNAGSFIERAIQSCIKQTYKHIEIIIVDDGSTDNTLEIVSAIRDERIKVIRQENGGVCSARNAGIELSRGKYLFFLDADDELVDNCLEVLLSLFSDDVDIVFGTSANETIERHFRKKTRRASVEKWNGETGLTKSLLDNPYTYAVWNKLYLKSFIGDTRFYEGKKIHEDSFFLFELFTKKPSVIICNETTYLTHAVQYSASRQCFSDKFYDILFFRDRKIEIINQQYPCLTNYIGNIIVKSDMALLNKLILTKGKENEEKKLIKEIKHNKKCFAPASNINKRFFFIITHNLYFIYKALKIKASMTHGV